MNRPYVILVGMDFTELAQRALLSALELASRYAQAELHVVSVVPDASTRPRLGLASYWMTAEEGVRDGVFASLQAHVQTQLDAFAARHPHRRLPERVMSHVCVAPPTQGIVQLAEEIEADVIVLGRHGHRDGAASLGSVAEGTLQAAHCPVLVVPQETPPGERWSSVPPSLLQPACSARIHPSVRP